MKLESFLDFLASPTDNRPLKLVNGVIATSDNASDRSFVPINRTGSDAPPVGVTDRLLLCEDGLSAFPVVDEIPILLAPEMLMARENEAQHTIDLSDPRYAEAYEEMDFYNGTMNSQLDTPGPQQFNSVMGALASQELTRNDCEGFPEPASVWIDAKHDSISQLEAYRYLAPVQDKVFLQLGGSGSHAVKVLLAGARTAFLLTPMLGEARFALQLAKKFGVADRLACVLAVGEELPFVEGAIDIIYSGGCFHHMRLDYVASEMRRVLRDGGKFSGVDPWKTLLHTVGTKLVGKRETSVYCKPITPERIAPMLEYFTELEISHNGPFLRYAFLGLEKVGLQLPLATMMKITRVDNAMGRFTGLLKHCGGSLVIAGCKRS